MTTATNWNDLEQKIGAAVKLARRPVAVTFLDSAPTGVTQFSGTEPSGCSFWRLAAGGKTFFTVPENHFNCAVGAYTHNIPLSPERAAETEQTLKMMFELGYVKPEEVPQIPRLPKTPAAILYSPLGDSPAEPDVVLFACKPSAANAAERSRRPRRRRRRPPRPRPPHLHGAAGNDGARLDHEPGVHRQPRLHRTRRRRNVFSCARKRFRKNRRRARRDHRSKLRAPAIRNGTPQ